jgi:branched-chain amino acid transport system ATP-binding protein
MEHTICFGGLTAFPPWTCNSGERSIGLIGQRRWKTTVFNLITGVYRPTQGKIEFSGHSIVGHKPYAITAHGIARTFQNIRLFESLSVFDNVRVGFHLHLLSGINRSLWRGRAFATEEREIAAKVMEMLEMFNLHRYRDEPARCLPYGDQRRLEIVRALATRPRLLLLDEPAAGMNPTEKAGLMKLIQFIQENIKLPCSRWNMIRVVMGICERILVLDYGEIAEGTPGEVRRDPKFIKHLGRDFRRKGT